MDIRIEPRILSGEVRAISSKSDVHRLALAAALSKGETKIGFTTLADDIKATFNVLSAMGAEIEISGKDGDYIAKIRGIEKIPDSPILDANECGTTARIILPVAAALSSGFTMTGKNGLLKRPFGDLVKCMEENGTKCSSEYLPISTCGRLKSGVYSIRGDVSSQYISGLLFALPLLEGDSEIVLTTPLSSAGYVEITLRTLANFGIEVTKTSSGFLVKGNQKYISPKVCTAEGDWSNSLFWLCGAAIGNAITVNNLNADSPHKDRSALNLIKNAGALVHGIESVTVASAPLCGINISGEDIPDALPILATMLSLAKGKSVITGGARLKIKESDRIKTTTAMLTSLGVSVEATDDGFIIDGVESFKGGVVDAANDHRIAMCAAIASQRATGDVIIKGAECVNKSYPTFFEDFKKLGGKYSVIDG